MDLQTADGLFHHLSSCCMAGGQYDRKRLRDDV